MWEKIYGYWNGGDQRYAAFTVNKKGLLQFEYGKWDTVGRGAGYVEKALSPIVYGTEDEIRLQVYWPAYESEVTGRLEEMTAAVTLRVKDIDNEEIDVQVGDEAFQPVKKPGVDKGPQPLMFNPALTTCASERMKTQRFFVLCGFCRPGANARGKTRKTQKWHSATFLTL